jgi:hypothetical protein
VAAEIVTKPSETLTLEAVSRYLEGRLARYKIPLSSTFPSGCRLRPPARSRNSCCGRCVVARRGARSATCSRASDPTVPCAEKFQAYVTLASARSKEKTSIRAVSLACQPSVGTAPSSRYNDMG